MSACGYNGYDEYDYDNKEEEQEPFRILVVGECGDGKSSLIKAFLKNYGGKWVASLQSGVKATGVSKAVISYPLTIGGRRAEIFDTPGVGDATIKISHLVAVIEAAMQNNKCHAIIICNQMNKNRVGLGAQVVASLIKSGIVEKNNGAVHENIIFVGTQLDMYVAGCRTPEKRRKKIAKWDSEVPPDMNKRCGFTGKDSITVCHTSIVLDDDEPMDQEDMEIDISEPSKALLRIMRAGRSVKYYKPDSNKFVKMLAEETALDIEDKKMKEMEEELEKARKQLEEVMAEAARKAKDAENQSWWNTIKDVGSTMLGGAAGFAAGGPIGALLGLTAGLGGSKVDSAIRG